MPGETLTKVIAVVAAVVGLITAAFQQQGIINAILAIQCTAVQRKRLERKRRREELGELPLMKNLFGFRERPQQPLGPYRDAFGAMTTDVNRNYCQKLTHLYSWELLDLADLVRDDVEAARETNWKCRRIQRPVKHRGQKNRGRPPKVDYINRLVYVLEWLATGDSVDRQEFHNSWSRSSCDEDRKHVLKAICKALIDEVKWPTEEERAEHYSTYNGIFVGCVGVFDVTEWITCKWADQVLENETYSGKAKSNTMKTLAVINKHGHFIWVDPLAKGKRNDRDQWTSCDLYLNAGTYFGANEWLACDGGFRGDGPQMMSYDDLREPGREIYNLAFREVRVGVENAFGRVQMWFPIFGAQKRYWNQDLELLQLAVDAAMRLHNWILRKRGLSYDAQASGRNHLREYY